MTKNNPELTVGLNLPETNAKLENKSKRCNTSNK